MTMPRTLPFGFWSATTLPSPMAWLTWCGMSALAKQVATATKCCEVTSSSRTSLRISAVNPEGPGAAPFLAFRRLVSSCVAGRLGGAGGWNSVRCCGNSWYGWGGRLAGSRSSWRVASVLGANGPAGSESLAGCGYVACCRALRVRCSLFGVSGEVRDGAGRVRGYVGCLGVGGCGRAEKGCPFPFLELGYAEAPIWFGNRSDSGWSLTKLCWPKCLCGL